ncbi:Uncharacterised protein [Legionella beliardensis]|uniref:Uncharacterized protein n=1 Tax=Legionella beliardensis TaxID=91822 RepID=A0A378I101_9GAMM|nr:hypothetical protein [Legionella beliardensis]STX28345.1 Uncharacterised protein [Legionella beliardensis]
MEKVKINFTENEVTVITSFVGLATKILNVDHIINQGLTITEWQFLCNIMEVDVLLIPDKRGNITPISPSAVIKKIEKVVKQK